MAELILFLVSVLPVFLLGLFIYKNDRDKEPFGLLLKLFVGGILSCFLTIIISLILDIIFPFFALDYEELNLFQLIIHVFIGVALIEEFCKWIFVYKFSFNDRFFDEPFDMIIYASFVALGFAGFENLFYVSDNGLFTGIVRAITAVPGHFCDGVFMGYYLTLAKLSILNNRNDLVKKNLFLSIVVPVVLHGIYDYCLMSGNYIFYIIFVVFVVFVYILAYKKIKRLSSVSRKFSYKDNFCPNCGKKVVGNYCVGCGRKNE